MAGWWWHSRLFGDLVAVVVLIAIALVYLAAWEEMSGDPRAALCAAFAAVATVILIRLLLVEQRARDLAARNTRLSEDLRRLEVENLELTVLLPHSPDNR